MEKEHKLTKKYLFFLISQKPIKNVLIKNY